MYKILIALTLTLTTCLFAKPSTVVFDYGDVIATPDRSIVTSFLKETFKANDEEIDSAINDARQVRKQGGFEFGFWQSYGETRGIELPEDWMKQYKSAIYSSIVLDQEVYKLVLQLKKEGYHVCMLSNIDKRRADFIRKVGHYEPFDPVILSCEYQIDKPDRRIYDILLEKLDQKPEECLFVDNKQENIDVAKDLGMDAILFESAVQLKEELVKRTMIENEDVTS